MFYKLEKTPESFLGHLGMELLLSGQFRQSFISGSFPFVSHFLSLGR